MEGEAFRLKMILKILILLAFRLNMI